MFYQDSSGKVPVLQKSVVNDLLRTVKEENLLYDAETEQDFIKQNNKLIVDLNFLLDPPSFKESPDSLGEYLRSLLEAHYILQLNKLIEIKAPTVILNNEVKKLLSIYREEPIRNWNKYRNLPLISWSEKRGKHGKAYFEFIVPDNIVYLFSRRGRWLTDKNSMPVKAVKS